LRAGSDQTRTNPRWWRWCGSLPHWGGAVACRAFASFVGCCSVGHYSDI